MRASTLPKAAFGLVVLAQQSRASGVQQLHYLSKRGTTPGGRYALDTIKTCSEWYDNYFGRSCEDVRDWMFAVSPEDFSRWNPSVTIDCGNWQELSYCVRVKSEEKPRSTSSSSTVKPTPTSMETIATPKPTLLRWDALGCYVDRNTLSTRLFEASGSGLSVTNCEKACFDNDFRYAGVKAGTECWCGTYVPAEWTEDQTDCNTPCAGDGSQICGGTSVFNVFEAQYKDTLPPPSTTRTKANPLPTTAATNTAGPTTTSRPSSIPSATPTWQALGCYKDMYPATKRTLAKLAETNDQSLTPARCQGLCQKNGFAYAGVENGRECWCGEGIQDGDVTNGNGPAATDACNTPCSGDGAQFCGAGARIYLYHRQDELDTSPTQWLPLGCYGEEVGRILPHQMPVPGGADRNNTRAGCIETCDAAGYTYAGLENGRECWCDNAIQKNGQLASDGAAGCNKPCTGKTDETCGGLSRLDVFFKAAGL